MEKKSLSVEKIGVAADGRRAEKLGAALKRNMVRRKAAAALHATTSVPFMEAEDAAGDPA